MPSTIEADIRKALEGTGLPVTTEEVESTKAGIKFERLSSRKTPRSVVDFWRYVTFEATVYLDNQNDDTLLEKRLDVVWRIINAFAVKDSMSTQWTRVDNRRAAVISWESREVDTSDD